MTSQTVVRTLAEPPDLFAKRDELGDAPVQVGGMRVEQSDDVAARRAFLLPHRDDLSDLAQGARRLERP